MQPYKHWVKRNTPDRIRTCNLLLRRQAIYPLIYGRMVCCGASIAWQQGEYCVA
jgi:hypothetical protein